LGILFLVASAVLWAGLLSGRFRRETARTTGRVVDSHHYKFVYRGEVFDGTIPQALPEGTPVHVFFDPADPSRHHATTDGRPPDLRLDSGNRLPIALSVFALTAALGFGVAVLRWRALEKTQR